jgi:hypothetical protein
MQAGTTVEAPGSLTRFGGFAWQLAHAKLAWLVRAAFKAMTGLMQWVPDVPSATHHQS